MLGLIVQELVKLHALVFVECIATMKYKNEAHVSPWITVPRMYIDILLFLMKNFIEQKNANHRTVNLQLLTSSTVKIDEHTR